MLNMCNCSARPAADKQSSRLVSACAPKIGPKCPYCVEFLGRLRGVFGGHPSSSRAWDNLILREDEILSEDKIIPKLGPEDFQTPADRGRNRSKSVQNALTALSFWADFGPLTRVEDPLKRSPKIGLRRVWGRVFGLGPIEIAKACIDHER